MNMDISFVKNFQEQLKKTDFELYNYLESKYQEVNYIFLKTCLLSKNNKESILYIFNTHIISDSDDNEFNEINISGNIKQEIFNKIKKIDIMEIYNIKNIYLDAMNEIRKMTINNIRIDIGLSESDKDKYIEFLKNM